ncbi:MAG: APC family permease [Gemmatimonadota bacterium]
MTTTGADEHVVGIPRTLGRMDLVLLKIVAIVNINNIPPTAVFGRISVVLWLLAFVAFFVPEAVAVLIFSQRYAGEGGIYLWIRKEFGEAHGFIAGWCYWTNNLLYIPVVLVYMAGIFAYSGGESGAGLADSKVFVSAFALGWLVLMAVLNIRGLKVGKWIQNIGGIGTALSVVLVLAAAGIAIFKGVAQHAPLLVTDAGAGSGMAASFSVMCMAFIGIELASTMGDEIRDPARDLRPAIFAAGAISLASYALVTGAVLLLVPLGELGVIQGIMQAVASGAKTAGAAWLIGPVAVLMGLSIGGSASAWFAGSTRVPFVAGLDSALPAALGRIHPKWRSPYIALIVCAVLAGAFTVLSLIGSSVAEAYQVLLKAAVVIQLVPFVYLFLALVKTVRVTAFARGAGMLGLLTTVVAIVFAFLPTAEVASVATFELKLVVGVVGPTAIGWVLFRRGEAGRRR